MKSEHNHYMDRAIELARVAMAEGNGPSGCVIVRDGQVVGESRNLVQTTVDPTAHSELMALRNAARRLKTVDLSGATLYTTMEPCPMCCWAILDAKIKTIVLGARINEFRTIMTGSYSVESLAAMTERRVDIITGVREKECKDLRYDALELMVRRQKNL
jgi:tRNA(adenine34) deaminase